MSPSRFTLCRLADLPEAGAREFSAETVDGILELFVIRRGRCVHGYVNSCPHTGAPLNWSPDVFRAADGRHIQCTTHDALFTVEEGRCVAGPCPGSRLTSVGIDVAGDRVLLAGRNWPQT